MIYSVAIKSGLTETEAEEVVQETVICVAKSIQKFKRDRARGSFKGWLRNLTRWRIADQLRKRTVAVAGGNTDARAGHEDELGGANGVADWERERHMHHALARGSSNEEQEQYQLFDLCVVKQWPVSRITTTLEVSAARVYLARHRIGRLIEKEVRRLEKEWERG